MRKRTVGIIKKHNLSLYKVAKDFVSLRKKGTRNYIGLCPFHKETTPSFVILEGKKVYKCLGCGASGTLFDFLYELNPFNVQNNDELLLAINTFVRDISKKPQYKNHHIRKRTSTKPVPKKKQQWLDSVKRTRKNRPLSDEDLPF